MAGVTPTPVKDSSTIKLKGGKMKFKKIMTISKRERKVRLFRLIWERGIMGQGGYSAFLSFGLMPKIWQWNRNSPSEALFVIFGIVFHYRRSYGGRFV